MGCTSSKPSKKATRLTASNIRRYELNSRALEVDHATQRCPIPVSRKHTLEEILDPEDIPIGAHVRSPSGNLLSAQQFRERTDRPPCIRERQERILERTRTFSNLAEAAKAQDRELAEVCDSLGLKSGCADSFT